MMSEWEKIREKYVKIEKIGIGAMVTFFVIGIISDICVAFGYRLITLADIEAFSLTVLQIQATVGTLTLTIIALITGNISDSNLGVSVTDYYMNIRPKWLKQKRIIYTSLLFILSGVICFGLKLHNILFFIFLSTLVAVVISIAELYSAFKGKNETDYEIEEYIRDMLAREGNIEEKKSYFHGFIDEWKKKSNAQDKESYEHYFDICKIFMEYLYNTERDEALKYIQKQGYRIAYCLLSSENKTSKERGIIFIQDTYEWICGRILGNPKAALKYSEDFSLLSDVSREMNDAIDNLEAEKVEKIFLFYNFFDFVHGADIWLGEDKRDLSEVYFLARKLGYYLKKQKSKGNLINYTVWLQPFKHFFLFSTYNIPEERSEDYLNEQWKIYFDYCYGMIVHNMEEIVKQGLYCTSLNNLYRLEHKQEVLLYLSVHCFVYYLAEREEDSCVDESVRKSAKNLLYCEDVKNMFYNLLYMLSERTDLLTQDVPKKLEKFLDRYELFPRYSASKTMIMSDVVQDFYLFLILYIENEFYAPDLLEKNINGEFASTYLGDGAELRIKSTFEKLYEIIYVGEKADAENYNETIAVKVAGLYDNLRRTATKKQKEHYIRIAREEQEKYENSIDKKAVCKELERKVAEKLKEKFAPVLSEKIADDILEIPVLRLETYTSHVNENCIDGFYSHICGLFLEGIVRILKENNVLEWKMRNSGVSGDAEYLEYLKTNAFKILAGSEVMIRSRSYQMSKEISEQLEKYETIYTTGMWGALALKENAINICLHDVQVTVESATIEKSSARYDESKNKYQYAIINDVPLDFDEEELREYLHNHRKKIAVNAIISIQVNEKPVGTVFEKKHFT